MPTLRTLRLDPSHSPLTALNHTKLTLRGETQLPHRSWFNPNSRIPSLGLPPRLRRRVPLPLTLRHPPRLRRSLHPRRAIHRLLPLLQHQQAPTPTQGLPRPHPRHNNGPHQIRGLHHPPHARLRSRAREYRDTSLRSFRHCQWTDLRGCGGE